jgi:hypothetical protein
MSEFDKVIAFNYPVYASLQEFDNTRETTFLDRMVDMILKDNFATLEIKNGCYEEAVEHVIDMGFTNDTDLVEEFVESYIAQRGGRG